MGFWKSIFGDGSFESDRNTRKLHSQIQAKCENYCKHIVDEIPSVCSVHGIPLQEVNYINGFNEPGSALVCRECYKTMHELSQAEIDAIRRMGHEPIKRILFEHCGMVQKSNNVECVDGFIDLDPQTLVTLGSFHEY